MKDRTSSRRPKYSRAKKPPPMRFQKRDGEILLDIYDYDGVMARRQLKDKYWSTTSQQAMERRLSLLYHNEHINWPNIEQRRTKPTPEPIVWLDWRGMLWIARQAGVAVETPNNGSQYQLRALARSLRDQGIRWLREPRWIQLEHDLAVVDLRIIVEKAVDGIPHLFLEEWVPEGAFLSNTDVVEYRTKGKEGEVKREKKGIRPDGYFVITDEQRLAQGQLATARFLLELDNSTYDNLRFGREKVVPGAAYIKSQEYKKRFGNNSGNWLVVTTGEKRMMNMKRQAELTAGKDADIFLFTTFNKVTPKTVLTSSIWYRGWDDSPVPLFTL